MCVCVLQPSSEALYIEKNEGTKQKIPSVKNSKISILLLCHKARPIFTTFIYEKTQCQRLGKSKDSCLDLQLYFGRMCLSSDQFFEDFVTITFSSSWMFLEQKMSNESSMKRSMDGDKGVCFP